MGTSCSLRTRCGPRSGGPYDMALRPRNILSLCAGVGGLELGILLALHHRGEAGRGICYVEREAAAGASLVASMEAGWLHPAPVWSDMLTFDARPWRGVVHILASGDPCQDNSVAGKRAGADGARFLAPEVCRLAEECRPDLIFRENVPGNADGQLEAIIPPLERLGYRVAAGIFSSAETGNTMRRERLFIMAQRQDEQGRLGAGPERECLSDAGGCGRTMARAFGSVEEGREPGAGEAACGWPLGQSGGPSGALAWATGARPLPGAFGRLHCSEEGAGPRDAESERRGGEVDCTERDRRRSRRDDHGSDDGYFARSTGEVDERPLGGSSSTEPQGQQRGQQRGQHHPGGRQVKGGHPVLSGRAVLPPAVIPGPTDSRWIDVLDRFPELQPALSEEEAQSHLRRGTDAMAHRVERLRATGNGVDPVVAAYAFLSLGARLGV
ncbi:DNA cytosine methyltransferase [Sphingobium fuliginis ATCC 27551]|uniref:DNA cytosine methyltransferase n=1 Tax=Sphingobium fuliginis ATCC 27551 TaxID=1208342 RepID=A0A5B8CEV5_SPHSA|nr:DNA cytosine methyltransferase [Sphingobium fuliginis ATCC 27551]